MKLGIIGIFFSCIILGCATSPSARKIASTVSDQSANSPREAVLSVLPLGKREGLTDKGKKCAVEVSDDPEGLVITVENRETYVKPKVVIFSKQDSYHKIVKFEFEPTYVRVLLKNDSGDDGAPTNGLDQFKRAIKPTMTQIMVWRSADGRAEEVTAYWAPGGDGDLWGSDVYPCKLVQKID